MANIFDNDILVTKTNDSIFIDLTCGFGQPCVTTIYLKKNNGVTEKLKTFDNDTINLNIGRVEDLKYSAIEIHTTIDDIRNSDEEKLDIYLDIKVYDKKSNIVDTAFTKKTKGVGSRFHSFYNVTIF